MARSTRNSATNSPRASTAASCAPATGSPLSATSSTSTASPARRPPGPRRPRPGRTRRPAYPRGYHVLGPRILWLPRLRPLADEPWNLEHIDTMRAHAADSDAATLGIDPGDPVVLRPFECAAAARASPGHRASPPTRSTASTTPAAHWFSATSSSTTTPSSASPSGGSSGTTNASHTPRPPTENESIARPRLFAAVLVFARVTRTTTTPLGSLSLADPPRPLRGRLPHRRIARGVSEQKVRPAVLASVARRRSLQARGAVGLVVAKSGLSWQRPTAYEASLSRAHGPGRHQSDLICSAAGRRLGAEVGTRTERSSS